jgi:hypothetical protein
VWAIAIVKLAAHLATNAFGGYGYFRDELYYLACAGHPAWGYVDQPPLSIWLLALWKLAAGTSLFALRLLPALAGTAVVLLTARLARELGGGSFAQSVAALAATVSLIGLAFGSYYSMNVFDLLLWAAAFLVLARLLRRGEPHCWLWLGGVLGLGMLNKAGALWLAIGIAVAIVASGQRRWLATRWPYLGAAIAGLLALPFLLWNATHDWAHLEFIERALATKYSGLSSLRFLSDQLLIHNPMAVPLWAAGLLALLFAPRLRSFRPLAWVVLAVAAILVINGRSKAEYLASAFSILLAAGGVAWEGWTASAGSGEGRGRRLSWGGAVRGVLVASLVLGAALAPLTLPILPVESYLAYARALGIEPSTSEGKELAELPQHYADHFGWPEKAAAVARVFRALPAAEQAGVILFTTNYGRAGAIDFFGAELGLPKATCGHNNYWLWGPPAQAQNPVVILLGGEREDHQQVFDRVELAGVATCEYCMPYERDVPIFVARGPRVSIREIWPRLKHYD